MERLKELYLSFHTNLIILTHDYYNYKSFKILESIDYDRFNSTHVNKI